MSADQDEKRASSSFPAPPLSLNRPVLGKGLVVSKQKRSRLVQRPHENTESSEVQVPPTLRPLLGDHLSLRRTGMGMASSLITQQTSAQAQVLPSPSARGARARSRSSRSSSSPANALRNALSFSQRGQLPTSSISLQAMKSKLRRTPDTADPTQTSIPSNPSISARRERERKRERDSNISNYNNTNASSISKQDAQQQLMEKKLQEAVAKSQREEYEKYLMSPFSFIDKVIESPYTEEFVYLNSNGAYDLQIVKHDQIDPDNYYTMSRAGVTHFYHTETDFTSLDQWEREYFLYTKMMEIPFFKKYRGWKGFYFWKKLIRATKSNKYRKFLGENLYVLNNYLCTSLIKLRELCYKASRWTLFKVDPKKTLTLDQFRFEQAKQIDQVMEDLKKLNKDVRTIVSRACDIDLCEFLINNGFRKSKGDDSSGSGGKEVDMAGGNDDDYPQKISHAEKAAIRTKCRKLTKYIRLADYFIIDTLVTLCLDRTGDVLGLVERKQEKERKEKERKEKELMEKKGGKFDKKTTRASKAHQKEELLPLFSVELALDNKTFKLQFDPPVQEFQAQLEHSIDHAVKKVMAPKRLIKSDDFNSYTQVNVEDGDEDQALEFKLDSMVFQEESFIEVKQGIKQGLANAFVKAAKYATKFEPYRDIFVDNEQTDIASYRDASILEFSQLINKYTAQIKLFDDIATSSNIGVIQVDSSALKARLVPSPKQRLKEVERLLPRVAREKADQLLDELSKANLKISVVPNDVDHFVEIMAFLAEIQEKQQQNQERYLFIAELYNLMHEYKIRVADEDKLIFEKLTTTRTMFKNSIFFSEASINSNTEKFNKELTLDIPILSKNIDDVIVLMTDDCISAIPTDPQDVENVLKFLEEAEMTLEDLEAKATKFRNYQDVLQTPDPVDFDNIRTARADLDIKMELWSSIKTWVRVEDVEVFGFVFLRIGLLSTTFYHLSFNMINLCSFLRSRCSVNADIMENAYDWSHFIHKHIYTTSFTHVSNILPSPLPLHRASTPPNG